MSGCLPLSGLEVVYTLFIAVLKVMKILQVYLRVLHRGEYGRHPISRIQASSPIPTFSRTIRMWNQRIRASARGSRYYVGWYPTGNCRSFLALAFIRGRSESGEGRSVLLMDTFLSPPWFWNFDNFFTSYDVSILHVILEYSALSCLAHFWQIDFELVEDHIELAASEMWGVLHLKYLVLSYFVFLIITSVWKRMKI